MSDFILASASPRRLQLLDRLGIKPDHVIPADLDETPLEKELPRHHAGRLAREKALKIAEQYPDALILAADTVVACGRRILPKTENIDEARDCLKLLSGRRHRVYGGIAIINKGEKPLSRVVETVVSMKRLSVQEQADYIQTEQWRGVAGGYSIQGIAESFIKQINGSHSNIIGLCLYNTRQMLTGIHPELFK